MEVKNAGPVLVSASGRGNVKVLVTGRFYKARFMEDWRLDFASIRVVNISETLKAGKVIKDPVYYIRNQCLSNYKGQAPRRVRRYLNYTEIHHKLAALFEAEGLGVVFLESERE